MVEIYLDTETGTAEILKGNKSKEIDASMAIYVIFKSEITPTLKFSGNEQHYVIHIEIDKKEFKSLKKDFSAALKSSLKEKKIKKILESDDCGEILTPLMESRLKKKDAKKFARLVIRTVDDSSDYYDYSSDDDDDSQEDY